MKKNLLLFFGIIIVFTAVSCKKNNPAAPSAPAATATASPTFSITTSKTATPTITATGTDTGTYTVTMTATQTFTDTVTYTATATATPTATCTNTPFHIALQQGVNAYSGAADNQLDQASPDMNFGASSYGFIGVSAGSVKRLLIKYDLTSVLASGNTVVQANLLFTLNNIGGTAFNVIPYAVLRDWVEGNCTGGGCASYSSWNTYDTGLAWAIPGGDYGAAAGPAAFMDTAVSPSVPRAVTINADVVNSWLAFPPGNLGLLIMSDNEAGSGFILPYLKEYSTVSARPVLDLYYY